MQMEGRMGMDFLGRNRNESWDRGGYEMGIGRGREVGMESGRGVEGNFEEGGRKSDGLEMGGEEGGERNGREEERE